MMKRLLSRLGKRFIRQGEVGQTVVILAFGFIVLLAFVGIVTDVSLMFVRYTTLRRAVDAAAVSAAGQMRRAVATNDEIVRAKAANPGNWEQVAFGYAYARNIATVNLAARQFIEFYGLNPSTVLVDTCATARDPGDDLFDELECSTDQQPRKLVKVTAQIESPTVFLRLIGWGNVTLEASAISETAVLDVVMIFDVSESMLNQTTYGDWANVDTNGDGTGDTNWSMRYFPPRVDSGPRNVMATYGNNPFTAWQEVLKLSEAQMRANPNFQPIPFMVDENNGNLQVFPAGNYADPRNPREDCRIRFFPGASAFSPMPTGAFEGKDDVRQEMTVFLQAPAGLGQTGVNYPANWNGFVPSFNYFGCCNDPDGNWAFGDLVCQPMKKVRDASLKFLDRIDFARGDRVGFVTFDRGAYLIDRDGTGPDTHMMISQANAREALLDLVGVRAEPNFYADTTGNGKWDAFVTNAAPYNPDDPLRSGRPIRWNESSDGNIPPNGWPTGGFNNQPVGQLHDYPAKDSCYFQNASLPYPRSLYSSPQLNQSLTWPAPPDWATTQYNEARFPTPLSSVFVSGGSLVAAMHPNLNAPLWLAQMPGANIDEKRANMAFYAYELRAGCRGSNVGAGLRTANNALLDPATVRTNGAVWVMVMLGDGAAAGSDPVRRGGATASPPNLYVAYNTEPVPGDYGVYGVCPYGSPGDLGPLVDNNDGIDTNIFSLKNPYCMDANPSVRHFCFDPRIRDADGSIYVDVGGAGSECELKYDVDDFARDWADFIGLTDPFPALVSADQLGRTDLQLPTIFTIGFGLDFNQGAGTCRENILDCLGEELLRYIADVGDNNRMDMDYQQDLRADRFLDGNLSFNEDYGARGPCEGPVVGYASAEAAVAALNFGALVNPLAPGESCGNYFNAPNEKELQIVFDTIASRMFTRITR